MSQGSDDNQASLWEWAGSKEQSEAERLDSVATRGTLDLSGLPDGLRELRPHAHRLHVRLEGLLGIVDLILTDNRRRMLSSRRRRNRQEIRIHHMFVGCCERTLGAIADLASGRSGAREIIQEYIADNRDAISFEPSQDELEHRGEHHNLRAILHDVRQLLDGHGLDDVHITWGRRGRGSKSIRFGSYDFDRNLIRIHPALDRDWVPRFFVEFIIYHELLHAIFPPETGEGRRRVHTKEFRAMERRFPRYQKAMEWEAANLRRILENK